MAKIVAIANHKGGVGKSTTALNLGAALAAHGYRILFVDMDAQANLTDTLKVGEVQRSIYDALKGEAVQPITITEHIDVLPATLELATAEVELYTEIGREQLLKDVLQPLRVRYDFILIDTAPALGLLTTNAMACADYVIIPMQAEYYAMKGVKGLIDVINSIQRRINKQLQLGGIIITQYDTRTILHKQVRQTLINTFGSVVFNTPIRKSIAIAEAQAIKQSVFEYAPHSGSADDYGRLTDEFIQRFCNV